jgi:hypothetical protein
MKPIPLAKSLIAALLALGGVAGPQLAQARDHDECNAPVNQWQPRDAVRDMARQKGWRVERVKIDDGCYEIKGQDADGRRFKAKVDPVTLDVVRMKRADGGRGERGERRDKGAPAAPVNPSSGPRPQVEIR